MSRADVQERERLLDQIERLERENDKLGIRIGELTGHLDWIGWSSEGITKARAELDRLTRELDEVLKSRDAARVGVVNGIRATQELTRERDEARAVVDIARKATQPGVAVSTRHPHWLALVEALWSAEKARDDK